MKKYILLFLTSLMILSITGCFWRMKHPSEAYKQGNIQKAYELGVNWLKEHPEDIKTRKLTGKAALMLGDTLAAYSIWKSELLYYLENDELLSSKIVEFGMELGDLDYIKDVLQIRINQESIEKKREELQDLSAVVQMKKNFALHAYMTVEQNILDGDFLEAYDRIRDIIEVYPLESYSQVEQCLKAAILIKEGTDESVVKSMKLLEKILDDPAIQVPVLYISSRVYYEVGQSQKAIETLEKAKQLVDGNSRFLTAIDQLYEDVHKKKNMYDRR